MQLGSMQMFLARTTLPTGSYSVLLFHKAYKLLIVGMYYLTIEDLPDDSYHSLLDVLLFYYSV